MSKRKKAGSDPLEPKGGDRRAVKVPSLGGDGMAAITIPAAEPDGAVLKPIWDRATGTLWWRGVVVLDLARHAHAERAVLDQQYLEESYGRRMRGTAAFSPSLRPPISQLTAILLLALYVLNAGYMFQGTFTPIGQLDFASETFGGKSDHRSTGNRFRSSALEHIPVPVPKEYLLGLDTQNIDFEQPRHRSYLRGEWKEGGWWYYYLYGLAVKGRELNNFPRTVRS